MSFPGFANPIPAIANIVQIWAPTSRRNIGGIIPNVTLDEESTDTLTVTRHPVERGAMISDHAYKEPATLTMRCAWSNSNSHATLAGLAGLAGIAGFVASNDSNYVVDIYNKLLALQTSGEVFEVLTGKRLYSNMLMTAVQITTDETSEYALQAVLQFTEIIIVQTTPTSVPPPQNQKLPEQTAQVQNVGTQQLAPTTLSTLGH